MSDIISGNDWDIIEEDCRCKYLGIDKCRNSYSAICDNCRNNELMTWNTEDYYIA